MANQSNDARIVVIDDEQSNIDVLSRFLDRWGFTEVTTTTDAAAGLEAAQRDEPDLVMLDLHMPGMDGFEFLERFTPWRAGHTFLPVLVLTADATHETKRRALSLGANDVVTKPFDFVEVELRTRNLLETRRLHKELEGQNRRLEFMVDVRTEEVETTRQEVLDRLALAAEYRDDETKVHTQRIGRHVGLTAAAMGLPKNQVADFMRAAPLHDLGKIGIADHILLKPGKLTPAEFEVVKSHTTIGAEILSGSPWPVLEVASQIALAHHERYDGTGYPLGKRGSDIPLAARITTVVDVFDILVHDRVYRPAWPIERAVEEMRGQAGRQFDPDVVRTFLELVIAGTITP